MSNTELPNIFPLPIAQDLFVEQDIKALYEKILIDTIERVQGINPKDHHLLFDNCTGSDNNKGLITMLVDAMYYKTDLFLVYNPTTGVLREATITEREKIRIEYRDGAESPSGFYVSFKRYKKTDILRLYSALEYCLISALNKSLNISKSIKIKMSDLRASTSLIDSEEVIAQAKVIAQSLGDGKDVLVDVKDMIETTVPDLSAIDSGMDFLNQKRSFYLGLPKSYVAGQLAGGIGDSGNSDTKAIDRGLKAFYFSIVKPVIEDILEVETTFKAQDTTSLAQAISTYTAFEVGEDDLISRDEKRWILERLFDLDAEEE